MNKTKRLIIESTLWLVVWIILWVNQENDSNFIKANSIAFVLQVVLIFGLIYFASPKLLVKKKYFYFGVFSVAAVLVSAYISSEVFFNPPIEPIRPMEPPPPLDDFIRTGPRRENIRPPRFLINTLMLTLSYTLATLIETFLFVKKKEEEVIVTKNENLQNELKLLKSQINPHFLFNSLNNIYALSAINSSKTQQSISHLSDMLRYVLYECEQPSVSIKKEITYIVNYIKLFSLKSSKAYPIETNFNVTNPNLSIAPMLFIPFVENAFKHSNIEKGNDTFIKINIDANDTSINFEIENSMPQKTIIKDNVGGIGLGNVKKRLAILYPEKHKLEINESDTSFKVKLHLILA